jgi:hypothetical protein
MLSILKHHTQEAVKVVEVAEILPCLDTEPSGKNAWIISPALNVWSANVNTSAVRATPVAS